MVCVLSHQWFISYLIPSYPGLYPISPYLTAVYILSYPTFHPILLQFLSYLLSYPSLHPILSYFISYLLSYPSLHPILPQFISYLILSYPSAYSILSFLILHPLSSYFTLVCILSYPVVSAARDHAWRRAYAMLYKTEMLASCNLVWGSLLY